MLFVKAGFKLNEHRYLLAVFGSLGKRRDDRRITADAVERLLDSKNIRILGRALYELDDRVESLVRMMHENVMRSYRFKYIVTVIDLADRRRHMGLAL